MINCLVRYERLARQGRTEVASPAVLAGFAVRQIRAGRTVATRLNVRNPLSLYAPLQKGIRIERLDHYCQRTEQWIEVAAADRRAPIPEQVALRIDVRAWLSGLARRKRRIARDLVLGWRTGELARKYKLSPARISQLRRELFESWQQFHGLGVRPAAA